MQLFRTVTIKKQKILIYITDRGMFVAYEREQSLDSPNFEEIIDSADTYSVLLDRLSKKITRASRVKIAVPFSRLEVPTHHIGEEVQAAFRQYIVTGRHQGTGNWLVYDVQRDQTNQERLYGQAYYPSEIPQEELNKYKRFLEYQNKLNGLIKAWHSRNRINVPALAEQQLKENTPPTPNISTPNISTPNISIPNISTPSTNPT